MTGPPGIVERIEAAPIVALQPGSDPSEKAVGDIFASAQRDERRFDHTVGRWFEFDGARWRQDREQRTFHLISELAVRLSRGKIGRASFVRGAETFARANPALAIAHEAWDADPMALGTPAGTVDLRTGCMGKASSADLITRSTSVTPERGRPDLWLRFLAEATGGDEALQRFLRQVTGYALTGLTTEHALFFVHGAGKNGKSVFLSTVSRILGDYAVTAAMDTFTAARSDRHPTELARLEGARLVTASETEEGRAWAEAKIKQLTGGDKIAARFMHKDFFEFSPQFKLLIVGNHQPQLHSVDAATRRRFNIVPFTHTPAEPDPLLEEKLVAEHGRILSWMIEGCLDWQRNSLMRPVVVIEATEDYFEGQDSLGQWIGDRCETGATLFELPTPLFRDWSEFARANGEDPGTAKAFAGSMEKRGFHRRKSNGVRAYRGIALAYQRRSDAAD